MIRVNFLREIFTIICDTFMKKNFFFCIYVIYQFDLSFILRFHFSLHQNLYTCKRAVYLNGYMISFSRHTNAKYIYKLYSVYTWHPYKNSVMYAFYVHMKTAWMSSYICCCGRNNTNIRRHYHLFSIRYNILSRYESL